jgi:two-component system chemotaxis response regulator CheB
MRHALAEDFDFAADAVVIGASAGGIDALLLLLAELAPPVRAPIVAVLHLPEEHESRLVQVFAQRLRIPVREAEAHAPIEGGTLYFAPPAYHLLLEADRSFSLSCDPPVLYSRPSIDVLLESAADAYGERLAALILTGANEDGARGLACVKQQGGLTAVQDPGEAAHRAMAGLRSLLHTVVSR